MASEDGISYTTFGQIFVLVTAFGIAFVKAYLVAAKFMHLDVKAICLVLLTTCLVFMVLFFAAVSPDIQNHSGDNWTNEGAKAAVKAGIEKVVNNFITTMMTMETTMGPNTVTTTVTRKKTMARGTNHIKS